jgi:hypothetical protein
VHIGTSSCAGPRSISLGPSCKSTRPVCPASRACSRSGRERKFLISENAPMRTIWSTGAARQGAPFGPPFFAGSDGNKAPPTKFEP